MARQRGTTEAGTRRRSQILLEAEALVESVGFDDLKMESIADSIGIAKSTLYHYFPQKEDMLFAIHDETMAEQTKHLREIAASPESASERLRLAIVDQLRLIAQHPGRVRVLMDAKRDKDRPYRKEMAKLERIYLDELVKLIEAGASTGEFRTTNPKIVAEAVLGMTQHARYWLRPNRNGGYEQVANELCQLICDGLAPSA